MRCLAGISAVALVLALSACGPQEPKVMGGTPDLRRLTEEQYANIVSDVFGAPEGSAGEAVVRLTEHVRAVTPGSFVFVLSDFLAGPEGEDAMAAAVDRALDHDAIDRRADLGIAEIDLGLLEQRLRTLYIDMLKLIHLLSHCLINIPKQPRT